MIGRRRRSQTGARVGQVVAWSLVAAMPVLLGQGCPFGNNVIPVYPAATTNGATTPSSSTGNFPPQFQFLSLKEDYKGEVGDVITISWTDDDPDNNASILLLVDPDGTIDNGNEIILASRNEDDDGVGDTFDLDTTSVGMVPGTYRLIARVSDGVNAQVAVVAKGRLILYAQGVVPGNVSPTIQVTKPTLNLGVSQDEQIPIAYCGADRDNGEGGVTPNAIIILDYDNNPLNDLDLNAVDADTTLNNICQGILPKTIDGAIILDCKDDDDCADIETPTDYPYTVDVGQIPPRSSGEPYYVRVTMWDHTNPPVHAYAPGTISIAAMGSGVVDVGNVGRTISGTKFYGFDAGGETGFTGTDIGDLDGDGADDFVIVDRLGRPYELGNIGFARVVYGLPGQKFGSEIPVNSISTTTRGIQLPMWSDIRKVATRHGLGTDGIPGLTGTDGITSVTRLGDVTGDERPEILFGLPFVRQFWDYSDDDPCDCTCPDGDDIKAEDYKCYGDGLPNPWSTNCTEKPHEWMGSFDDRESLANVGCSNDDNYRRESIDGGYVVMVASSLDNSGSLSIVDTDANTVGSTIGLNLVGQRVEGTSSEFQFAGARWRGPWYGIYDNFDLDDITGAIVGGGFDYTIVTDNRFGETVSTMPDMADSRTTISPRYGRDVLISAPQGALGRGSIYYYWGQNFATKASGNCNSFPYYGDCDGSCGEGIGRELWTPLYTRILGEQDGDSLGYAGPAGDFNLDGSRDILCGAPGADRNGVSGGGIIYILFGRRDFTGYDLSDTTINPPRMEIHGTFSGDQFGAVQTLVGDVNQDGLHDIGFASPTADGPGGQDAGFVGIVFGGRMITGENVFNVSQVATSQLPGTQIYGTQSGGRAGTIINNAGDFNADGTDDFLVVAPNETRVVDSQTRRGVAYLIFGGAHLQNGVFDFSQVSTPELPGAVFVSPYEVGTADEAPIDFAGAAGDVNDDGFDDILIGVSTADFVNPLEPSQRRTDAGEMYLIYGNNTGTNTLGS